MENYRILEKSILPRACQQEGTPVLIRKACAQRGEEGTGYEKLVRKEGRGVLDTKSLCAKGGRGVLDTKSLCVKGGGGFWIGKACAQRGGGGFWIRQACAQTLP